MAQPSAYEQYVLELLNRARSDPGAEATRLGIGLNDGLPAGTLSDTPEQPLAFNPDLIDAAQQHSAWMLANNSFSHTGANGSSPGDRMSAAGYQFSGASGWGENIAIEYGSSTSLDQAMADTLETMLFKSPGHRTNILDGDFREVGVGLGTGDYQGQSAVDLTQDFADSGSLPFLTGVAYTDLNGDNFYEPGEGLGGLSVKATSNTGAVYQTTTWDAGGYQLQVPAGTYQVTFSGGALTSPVTETATIGSQNVELDLERSPTNTTPATTTSSPPESTASGDQATGSKGANPPADSPPVPSQHDTLTLGLSEVSSRGNLQFIAYLDGHQLGSGPQTVDVQRSAGSSESFTFSGSWGPGPHDLEIDLIGRGSNRPHGKLYVDNVIYDGATTSIGAILHGDQDYTMTVPALHGG
jgi:hypothetical protein